jgi:hypothetical protein
MMERSFGLCDTFITNLVGIMKNWVQVE